MYGEGYLGHGLVSVQHPVEGGDGLAHDGGHHLHQPGGGGGGGVWARIGGL